MSQPTSIPILKNLLLLRRKPKPEPTICDNCLYGHEEPCTAPGICRCLCHRYEDEQAAA